MNTAHSDWNVRFPAEWEAQDAVWLSWPHRNDLWQGGLSSLYDTYAQVARGIADHARVQINAAAPLHASIREVLVKAGISSERCTLWDHPTNDVWCRDHGAIFVLDKISGALKATDWQFNAWGGKFPPFDLDNKIPVQMANALGVPLLTSSMILEGGAIEGNGAGLLLTTESVLLNPNRNVTWTKQDMEAELRRMLGVQSIFWLGQGIEGDDTDGHIDDMVRFCREDAVVAIREKDSQSPHYAILEENWERLADMKTVNGSSIERIPLPMPDAIVAQDWRLEQLPASYANFLIVNDAVLVPIFMQEKNDDHALGVLREAFPKHTVKGIDARQLVIEGGAIHCITQQQPAPHLIP